MLRLVVFLATVIVAAPALAQTKPGDGTSAQGDPVTLFDATDATMNDAIAEARRTLPVFLEQAFTADGYGLPTATLKVAMPTASGGGDEIIWVNGLGFNDTHFTGYLANAPVDLGPLRQGDYVEFTLEQINDWGIRSPLGRYHGHYTTRVIADLPGNAHIWDLLEPETVPPEWR